MCMPAARRSARLAATTASGALRAMVSAMARAASISLSGSHSSDTSPAASARAAIDRLAGQDHARRERRPDHRREALRAAAARHAADAHLRQREARGGHGDADVAGERDFEPAAIGETVDRRDDRLARSGRAARRCADRLASGGIMMAWRSPPAENALPAPVRITARTAGSASKPANAAVSSARISSLMALSLSGRLSVTCATPAAM